MYLVLFDFDGTLTHADSSLLFLKYTHSKFNFWKNVAKVTPNLASHFLGLASAETSKKAVFKQFYKGFSQEKLLQLGKSFSQEIIPRILFQEGIKTLRDYQQQGHTIAIVSASFGLWLKPFCEEKHLACICTELDFEEGYFKGKFATKNCNGKEKVNRIKEKFELSKFEKVIAYGNSKGDVPMLELADEAYFRKFKF